jgi:hypothetical protein
MVANFHNLGVVRKPPGDRAKNGGGIESVVHDLETGGKFNGEQI